MWARAAAWTGFALFLAAPMGFALFPAVAQAPPPGAQVGPVPLAAQAPFAVYPLSDPFDYSDTVLLGNNNSQVSRNLTAYFQAQRNVPTANVLLADLPEAETITEVQWNGFVAWWKNETAARGLGTQVNYIVTFKGMPIRVAWTHTNGPGSFQDALMLLDGTLEAAIGNVGAAGYNNPYFNRTEHFSFERFGIRLVTGIYAYNESTALALIDRAAASLGQRGEFVLDTDASKGYTGGWGGYAYANQALVWANTTLSARGEDTFLDLTNAYITNRTGVMGYSSWGSNDCCWGSVTQNAKPHNTWVNGSIAETFVSTGGRSFTWPPSYGQSMIADWIDEGVTGIKGYTDEPYIHSIADGHILYGRYTLGYNLAESFWAASHVMGWRQIVIGDPKVAPYADIGDLSFNATRMATPSAVEQFQPLNITVAIENTAVVGREVDIRLEMPDQSRATATLSIAPSAVSLFSLSLDTSGLNEAIHGLGLVFSLYIDPNQTVRELDTGNNYVTFELEIRRAPLLSASFDPAAVRTFDTATLSIEAQRADRPVSYYVWSLDGGPGQVVPATGNSSQVSVSHNRSGTYTYEVFAVDDVGIRSNTVGGVVLTVLNRAPELSVAVNTTTPRSLEPVAFSSLAMDMDGVVVSYLWDAGPLGTWTTPWFELAFDRPGTFTVNLTVTDDEGAQVNATLAVDVVNRPPVAVVVSSALAALTNVPFELNASGSFDTDGAVVRYSFEFDGVEPVSGISPVAARAFDSPGVTGAWVTVTDDWGATARARVTFTVLDRPPEVNLTLRNGPTLFEGQVLYFVVNATDPDSNLFSYDVDYGDGERASGLISGRSTSLELQHEYWVEGIFTLTLNVTDLEGNTTSRQATLSVAHPPPHATAMDFTVDGNEMTLEWTIDSPYGDLVSILMVVDGVVWRTFHGGNGGVRIIPFDGLRPGNHTVQFNVTDGVKQTSALSGTFEVPSPDPGPPRPPPGTPTVLWGTMLLSLGAIAAVAAAVIAFFVWRGKRPPKVVTSQEAS